MNCPSAWNPIQITVTTKTIQTTEPNDNPEINEPNEAPQPNSLDDIRKVLDTLSVQLTDALTSERAVIGYCIGLLNYSINHDNRQAEQQYLGLQFARLELLARRLSPAHQATLTTFLNSLVDLVKYPLYTLTQNIQVPKFNDPPSKTPYSVNHNALPSPYTLPPSPPNSPHREQPSGVQQAVGEDNESEEFEEPEYSI